MKIFIAALIALQSSASQSPSHSAPTYAVASAHIGVPTASPLVQTPASYSLIVSGGRAAYGPNPAIAPSATFTVGDDWYVVPASQMSVLATQTVPTGPLSLTLVAGSGATAQAFQFAITASDIASWLPCCRAVLGATTTVGTFGAPHA